MLIAQITDFHYRAAGTRLFGYVDPHGMLENVIDHLVNGPITPDCVLVTGDIVNDGPAEDYASVAAMLARLPCPVYVTPGNHDDRALMGDLPYGGTKTGDFTRVIDAYPVRIIVLDSLVEGHHHGELGPDQLGFLDEALAASHKPTIIAFHHPPFKTGIPAMDNFDLRDASALAAVVSRHGHVHAILCGHLHRMIAARFAGTIAMTAPGTAHHVTLELAKAGAPRWIMEPPGYLLHRWSEADGLVSHRVHLPDFGPEAPFHDGHTHL